jgi:UPF0716 family protein affecting phage T7 exclusion
MSSFVRLWAMLLIGLLLLIPAIIASIVYFVLLIVESRKASKSKLYISGKF